MSRCIALAVDIYQKIEHDFGDSAEVIHEALKVLDAKTKGLISNRIIRAIIYLSDGNLEQFNQKVLLAQTDWRDVLAQAEYTHPDMQFLSGHP